MSGPTFRAWLSQTLPEYMLPTRFAVLEALPRTPNGKVDRQTLERTEGQELAVGTDYVPAQTELESQLAHIWQRSLASGAGRHSRQFLSAWRALAASHVGDRLHSQPTRPRSASAVAVRVSDRGRLGLPNRGIERRT